MKKGMSNIITGAILLALGMLFGGSIFTGNPGTIDYIFDILGIVLIVSGIVQMAKEKKGG